MVAEKKRSIFIRVISLLMVCVIGLSFILPVCAASKNIQVSSGAMKTVTIVTGQGWMYSWGLKKTTVTVTNTGSKPVTLYKNIGNVGFSWEGTIAPGHSKTYTAKGSAKKYYVKLQGSHGYTTVRVKTTAGSVY